jgi:hypothetical protein
VGDREILEIYLNSASKNTSETDLSPHGTKSLLTSVTRLPYKKIKHSYIKKKTIQQHSNNRTDFITTTDSSKINSSLIMCCINSKGQEIHQCKA